MKALISVVSSLLAFTVATAQPTPPAGVTSGLLGVPMPAGTTLSRNVLYRGAARMSLQMEAKKRGLTLGDPLEVFKVPMDAPWQTEIVATLQGAGWSVQPDATDPTLMLSEKAGTSVLLEFVAGRRDRYVYVNAIAPHVSAPVSGDHSLGAAPPMAMQAPPAEAPPAQAPPPELPAPAFQVVATQAIPTSSGGFEFTTTNFADGWVATDEADYVKATRGPITAYLFRRLPISEQLRSPEIDFEGHYWQRDVVPRYDIATIDRRSADRPAFSAYIEGEGTERATGRHVYVGMNVHRGTSGALNIVIVAPSKSEYLQAYPTVTSLESALGVNKFAVGASDVVGEWSESGSSGIDMFYVSTGGYAGRNTAGASNQFTFKADGTYTSQHAGGFGMSGSQQLFQTKYAGRWSMNGNWEVTLTNRQSNGGSDTFAVSFESVQGGRVLHMQNVKASGLQYHLGKAR